MDETLAHQLTHHCHSLYWNRRVELDDESVRFVPTPDDLFVVLRRLTDGEALEDVTTKEMRPEARDKARRQAYMDLYRSGR